LNPRESSENEPAPACTWALALLVAGVLYALTMAPGLSWGDSGDAQLRVLLGHWYDHQDLVRSHVPFYLVAGALSRLGIDAALAANLVSAASGAIAVANVTLLLAMLTCRRVAAVCGAAVLLLSHCLWHQATVAEVMTLSVMLMTSELVCLFQFLRARRVGWLLGAMFLNGLGLATHHLAALNWPAYVVMLLLVRDAIPTPRFKWLAIGGVLFVIGASPLIAVFAVGWQTYHDLGRVIGEMLAGRFESKVFNVSLPWSMAGRLAAYTAYSFPTPLLTLAPIGVAVLWRDRPRTKAVLLLMPLLVHFLFAARYNVADQHAFMLHTYVFLAILVGLGVDTLLVTHESKAWTLGVTMMSLAAPIVYAVVPEILRHDAPQFAALPSRRLPYRDPFDWFLKPWRTGDHGPETFARQTLASLPPDPVLLADSTPMPPLVYVQVANDFRSDVQISSAQWYQSWFPAPVDWESDEFRRALYDGRVFTLTDRFTPGHPLSGPEYAFEPRGLIFRVVSHPDVDR